MAEKYRNRAWGVSSITRSGPKLKSTRSRLPTTRIRFVVLRTIAFIKTSPLADSANHLKLDEPIHLNGVLHGQLLDQRFKKTVHHECGSRLGWDAACRRIKYLRIRNLCNGCFMCDDSRGIANLERREGIGSRMPIQDQRAAGNLRPAIIRLRGDF